MKSENSQGRKLWIAAAKSYIMEILILAAIVYLNFDKLKPLDNRATLASFAVAILLFLIGCLLLHCKYRLLTTISEAADDLHTIAEYIRSAQRRNAQRSSEQASPQQIAGAAEHQRRFR